MKTAKGIIKVMTEDQVTEAAAFAWSVYQDETKRTTPPYRSWEDVSKSFSTFTGRDSEYLLGYY